MKFLKRLIKRLIIFSILLALLVAGLLLGGVIPLEEDDGEIPYRTEKITRGSIAQLITASGTINPEEVVTIGTQVSGKITAIYVSLNDQVTKGQLLAEVDDSILKTQLKQSSSSLASASLGHELAKREYERTKTLVAKDYLPKVELERDWQSVVTTQASLQSAKINVERDELNLSYSKITSPVDGVIISQTVSNGQTIASSFQAPDLFKIAKDLTNMKIDMSVPESDISKISIGMSVAFTVDAFEDREFEGTVKSIVLNPNNQYGVVTYSVVVGFENKDRALLPGMTANIKITLSEAKNVLRVPASALRFSPPRERVNPIKRLLMPRQEKSTSSTGSGSRYSQSIYLWRENALEQVPVQVGTTDDLMVEVRSEKLKEDDVVVTGLRVKEE